MELWPAIMAPSAFQFSKTTPRCHEVSKLRQAGATNRLNGGWAGCHDRFLSARPVGGEMFLLTAPLMERPSGCTGTAQSSVRLRIRKDRTDSNAVTLARAESQV